MRLLGPRGFVNRTNRGNMLQKLCAKLKVLWTSGLDSVVVVAAGVLLLLGGSSLAEHLNKAWFSSPEEACRALFVAVKNGDERAVKRVLGGHEEIVSSGGRAQGKLDRALFVEKYQQMHRVVKQPDGRAELYVGSENWPFPVPLTSRRGKWHFDGDAAQETAFLRAGVNEAATIADAVRLLPQ